MPRYGCVNVIVLTALAIVLLAISQGACDRGCIERFATQVGEESLDWKDDEMCPDLTPTVYFAALFESVSGWHVWHCPRYCDTLLEDAAEALLRRGSVEFYHNAPEFLSLQVEMERWIRANKTVGMHPGAYRHVWRQLRRFTTTTLSSSQTTQDVRTGRADGSVNEGGCDVGDGACLWAAAVNSYVSHSNVTLERMPWLSVSRRAIQAAQAMYDSNVLGSTIVRSFNFLSSVVHGPRASIKDLLVLMQRMWGQAEAQVRQFGAASVPYLPFIALEELIGPASELEVMARRTRISASSSFPSRLSYQHMPDDRFLHSAVVLHKGGNQALSEVYGAAMDLLPAVYKSLCQYTSIVWCSPLLLTISVEETRALQLAPSLVLHTHTKRPARNTFDYIASVIDDWSASSGRYSHPPGFLDFMEAIAPILSYDLHGMRRNNFEPQTVSHSSGNNPDVNDVLLAILSIMARSGSIQPRLLSREELSEIESYNREINREEAAKAREESSESSNSATGDASEDSDDAPQSAASPTSASRKHRKETITLDAHIRDVVDNQVKRMFGSETIDYAQALADYYSASRMHFRLWGGLFGDLTGTGILILFLAALLYSQYLWNRGNERPVW